jgi:putative ubiquitin-RnfH superfamily antitoxin RatB of RatAB toxin-antitoxin module
MVPAESAEIAVEVAYALPERQRIVAVKVPAGTTAFAAAERSGIAALFEGLDLATARMGIFGKAIGDPRTHVLAEGDRVEIYRPLKADPKEARKARARKAEGKAAG